jgi:hypothetical protein
MFFDIPKIGLAAQDALADPAAIPCLQILRGYWEGLRQEGALPLRHEISPRGLGGALENAFVVERIATGMGRIRVAGSALGDVLGIEPRNMPLTMLFEPVARANLTRILEQVFTTATALDITMEAERMIGRPHLAARMILLPMRGSRGEYHQIIGALALSGTIGRAPRRFGITRMRSEALDAPASFITPTPGEAALSARLPVLEPLTLQPAKGAHLRLVHSRD